MGFAKQQQPFIYRLVSLFTSAGERASNAGEQQRQRSGVHQSEGEPETDLIYESWREGGVEVQTQTASICVVAHGQ